jgi:hypothetical protein
MTAPHLQGVSLPSVPPSPASFIIRFPHFRSVPFASGPDPIHTVPRADPRDHVLIVDSSPSTPDTFVVDPRSRFSLDDFVRSVAQIPKFYSDPPPDRQPFIRSCPPIPVPDVVPLPPKILSAPPLEDAGNKTRTNFTEQQRNILNGYLQVRKNNPYANVSDIFKLREATGLTARQIRTYLTNRRVRCSKEINSPRISMKK